MLEAHKTKSCRKTIVISRATTVVGKRRMGDESVSALNVARCSTAHLSARKKHGRLIGRSAERGQTRWLHSILGKNATCVSLHGPYLLAIPIKFEMEVQFSSTFVNLILKFQIHTPGAASLED